MSAGRRSAHPGLLGAAALVAAAAVHAAPGAVAWRGARCRLLPTLAGVGPADRIALTFDDGPDPRSTPVVLDVLAGLGWHATFFVLGSQVRRTPGLLDEILARGHELGVHGDRHRSHLGRPGTWVVDDVRRARDAVEDRTGVAMRWLRPPYGATSSSTLLAARRLGLQPVLWTSWGRDWRAEATPETTVADIEATWWPGATVLLHDSDVTSAPGSSRNAIGALPLLAGRWSGRRVGTLGDHGLPRGRWLSPAPAAPA